MSEVEERRSRVDPGPLTQRIPITSLVLSERHCAVPSCQSLDLTRDHIVPKAKGGRLDPDNRQVLCRHHNTMKGDMSQADFQALLGLTW